MQRMMKKRQLSLGPVLFFPPHLGVFGEIFLGDADENKHYVARFFTQKECMPWEFSGDFRFETGIAVLSTKKETESVEARQTPTP